MRFLKEAARVCIRPTMVVLIFQFIKYTNKGLVCDLLVSIGLSYICVSCIVAIVYWYIDKRLQKRK